MRAEALSQTEALEVTRRVAELGRAGIPLAEGLRAVADELHSGRLARVFRLMARESEQGMPLERILVERESQFPPHVVGLIRAARRTGNLERALTQLLEQHFRMRDLSRTVTASLAYPFFVFCAAVALVLLLEFFVVGQFDTLFSDFELPWVTQLMIWWSDKGIVAAAIVLLMLTIFLGMLRLVIGAAAWRGLVATIPLIGPIWHWSGVAQWTRLLGLMLEYHVPLPDALRLSADGSLDSNVGQVARQMARGAEQGRSLTEMLSSTYRLPATLVPIVQWGEQSNELASALRSASDMMEGRVRLRANLLRVILPPFVLLAIAVGVGLMIVALLLPLTMVLDEFSFLMTLA